MSLLTAIPVIGRVVESGLNIVDQMVEDKDQAARIKMEIRKQIDRQDHEKVMAEIKGQAGIVTAEVKGESWLQRNWRPMLMLCCIIIIANNYILVPYASMFTDKLAMLELPKGLWALLNIGVAGYIGSRGIEKSIGIYRGKRDK